MRLRTLVSLATGAAAGAGVMYLLDPEHGSTRRRQARRTALRQARAGAVTAAVDGRRRATAMAAAALAGYQQARTGGSPTAVSGGAGRGLGPA